MLIEIETKLTAGGSEKNFVVMNVTLFRIRQIATVVNKFKKPSGGAGQIEVCYGFHSFNAVSNNKYNPASGSQQVTKNRISNK